MVSGAIWSASERSAIPALGRGLLIIVLATIASLVPCLPADASLDPDGLLPGPGAMTVYRVTNPNLERLRVRHHYYDGRGFDYVSWDLLRPGRAKRYHIRDVPEIPSPWQGWVQLEAPAPFAAEVVGYDYPVTLG